MVSNLDVAWATTELLELRWLSHKNTRLLLVSKRSVTLLAQVLAVHKVYLGLACEIYPWATFWVTIVARLAVQTRALTSIDATCQRFVKFAAVLGPTHHPTLLSAVYLGPMRTICSSVSLIAFADLLLGGVLTLVW